MTTMTPTLLLVEDNPDDELMIMETLEDLGIADQVEVVRDGAAALDFLFGSGAYAGRDPSRVPRAVLLDLRLPKIGGLEVLRRLRARPETRRLPVIVFTSSNEERDLLASYDLGVNSYVRKPVGSAEFTRAVESITKYWRDLNQSLDGRGSQRSA